MVKRGKLEIIKDILGIIRDSKIIKVTPLIRRANLSTTGFKEYYREILEKEFVEERELKNGKYILISEKGILFLEKYQSIKRFIEDFDL
jgi:predicted transcriptional regulator